MSSPALAITTGANDAPRLRAGAVVASQETLSLDELQRKIGVLADSAQTTLTTVGTDLNDLTGDGRQLLANLNDATGATNRKHLAGILTNSDTMIAQLRPQVERISEQVFQLTADAKIVVGKMGPTVDNANQTITAIRQPAQADLAELQKTLEETRGLVNSLQVLVRANSLNTTYTIENLRMATDNLNQLTEEVKERPWSLVRIKQPKDRQVPKQGGDQ
jgi:chromosome segregation ATPase